MRNYWKTSLVAAYVAVGFSMNVSAQGLDTIVGVANGAGDVSGLQTLTGPLDGLTGDDGNLEAVGAIDSIASGILFAGAPGAPESPQAGIEQGLDQILPGLE